LQNLSDPSPSKTSSKINPYLRRRDCKLASKKLKIIDAYMKDGLKPKQIAKSMRLSIDFVSKAIQKFKYEV